MRFVVSGPDHCLSFYFEQSVSNCSRNKPFYGGRVVEENEMNGEVPVSDMRHAFRAL